MLKAGLTGGIGSGKSTVAAIFELLGVPVFYADLEGRAALNEPATITKLHDLFGAAVFDEYGIPDRGRIASKVFNDAALLSKLNGIIHPAVQHRFEHWLQKHSYAPYILKEAAILIESGSYLHLDKLILVTAPADLRIQRVVKRDKVTAEDVKRRMEAQLSDAERSTYAQHFIVNDEQQFVIPQVLAVHQQLSGGNSF
jgi:dephospho-CoA kinase